MAFWFLFAGKYFNVLFLQLGTIISGMFGQIRKVKMSVTAACVLNLIFKVANRFLLQLSGLVCPCAIYPVDMANALEAFYFLQVNYT